MIYFFRVRIISPKRVNPPPIIIGVPITSLKRKYAQIVAKMGSPIGADATMVGETKPTA